MSQPTTQARELSQYLTFILDGEEYGVPILKVNGIQGFERTTPIPNAPAYVMGIINLRGEVVPIINLRKRFGLQEGTLDAHTVVIVVRVEQADKTRTVGLVVDAVADVYDIKDENLHSTPDFGGKISDTFVRGLGMINEKLVILLEIDHLIDWKRVAEPEPEAATAAA
ncbi:MAG TPA: chemotaxis protein CheW [Hyphomicrobiales bacterium]|nr:chemotaxis protein CheW [Hyphomicrobiales bacterium]